MKNKIRTKTEQQLLIDRINRINGQVLGVKKMIEDSRYCNDILIQISAINNSLKSLGTIILEEHIKTCVIEEVKQGKDDVVNELTSIINRFYK
jgi:CsoR family transcriptional regulator, copper-sensing transcriptional repressor